MHHSVCSVFLWMDKYEKFQWSQFNSAETTEIREFTEILFPSQMKHSSPIIISVYGNNAYFDIKLQIHNTLNFESVESVEMVRYYYCLFSSLEILKDTYLNRSNNWLSYIWNMKDALAKNVLMNVLFNGNFIVGIKIFFDFHFFQILLLIFD